MNAPRLAGIPIDHVAAEMAAFPMASESALSIGLTGLDPAFSRTPVAGEDCCRLWRDAERHILGSFPAFSIDEAVSIRDMLWFGKAGGRVPLHTYLRGLAAAYLEVRGRAAVPRLPVGERVMAPAVELHGPLARERWRWLALALPPDLLLGALDAGGGPDRVELLSPSLELHLQEKGFAETHLHLGAGLDFPLLWVCALHAISRPEAGLDRFESPGAGMDEGRDLGPWLLRAALARHLLAGFLARRAPSESCEQFLTRSVSSVLLAEFGRVELTLLAQALRELRTGRLSASGRDPGVHARLRMVYTRMMGPVQRLATLDQAEQADPIHLFMRRTTGEYRSAEVCFVAQALAYLEEAESVSQRGDRIFAQLFWQTIRIRALFYRHIVQRPMTPGLLWFVRFYGRLSAGRKPLGVRAQLESALRTCGHGEGLRSLEVRTSPSASQSELREFVEAVDQVARNAAGQGAARLSGRVAAPPSAWRPSPEIGIVFHFTKDRGGGALRGIPFAHGFGSNADPRLKGNAPSAGNPTGYRYAAFHWEKRREAASLLSLLRAFPLTLELVRALDVCTDELGVPNWVLSPILAQVREASEKASEKAQRRYGVSLPGFRSTIHAGEDFVHLLTGLRNLDEAVEAFALRSGDRLGHGIALGVDPQDWARRAGRIPLPLEDRLWDLTWEWRWYARGGTCANHARTLYIEREMMRLARALFQESLTPFDLDLLHQALYSPAQLYSTGFPDKLPREDRDDVTVTRLTRYLTSGRLFERGRTPIWVETSGEGEVLAALQTDLRRKVGARGLTVEVNPTSNLLIGNLGDLTTHPLWRLRPPRPVTDCPPVSVCVGSDDPIVFGSDLRREYQTLCDALSLAGLSEEEIRQWISRVRTTGLETRFTRPERSGQALFIRS